MSDYPMLISNKLHSFRNFLDAKILRMNQNKVIPDRINIAGKEDRSLFCYVYFG